MKKLFTLLMMVMLTVVAKAAVATDYTSNVTFEEGEKSYLTDVINIDGTDYSCVKIGTSKQGGSCIAVLPAGTKTFSLHAIGWSKSTNTDFTLTGAGLEATRTAGAGNISGNSPYTFDVAGGYDPAAPFFVFTFDEPLAEESRVTLASDYRVVFYGVQTSTEGDAPAAGWDGTVTSSLDNVTMTSVSEFEGVTLKFNGANSIVLNSEEEDGETLYGMFEAWNPDFSQYFIWSPMIGGEAVINGDEVTLNGWVDYSGAFAKGNAPKKVGKKTIIHKAAEGETDYQFEMMDYGETFIIDGTVYEDQIDLFFNAVEQEDVEPFELTVTNDKEENAVPAGEVAEKLSWYFYATVPEGFEINRDIQATLYKDMEVFSTAIAGQMDGTTAYWTFRNAAPDYIQEAGQYTLVVPEGVITVNGAPNAEFRGVWGVTGVEPTHEIAVVSVKNGGEEPGVVERVTTTFELELAEEVSTIGENQAGVMLINNTTNDIYPVSNINPVGKLVYITMNLGEERVLTAPGEYMLQLPDHVVVDANGNYNAGGNYTWTIEGQDMQVINIEQAAVSVTEPDTWGDQKYQIALTLPTIPEGAVYGYCEGLMVTKDGVTSNRPFTTGEWGMFTLDGNNVLFVDPMICYTTDETYDGELREPGTYVAEAEIYFMDADWMEIAAVAKYTGSVVLPQVAPVTPQATITLVADEKTEVLYDGTPVAEANSLTLSFTKTYQNVSCVVDKLTVVDGDEDMAGYTFEEEVATEEPVLGEDGNWTVNFVKQPQNFASGHQYRIKVRAWEGEKFDEEWNIQPYDETIVVVNGVGADDEPVVELNMGTPVYTTFDSAVAPDAFPGITVSYPDNNLAEVYGDTEAWGYGAFALICTSANIFELDADGNFDAENPVASEHYASNFDVESVDLFARPALEANKKYVAIIDGMTVQNQMEWEDPIVWIQSPMEAIWIYFETGVATGINNVNADDNTNTYNVAGQRVNNSVKGIVIKNGKKYLNK